MRKVGKLKTAEVRGFQSKFGLQVDGKVGNQTWGQVLELPIIIHKQTMAIDKLEQKIEDLEARSDPLDDPDNDEGFYIPGPVWFIVGGLVVYLSGEFLF